MIGMDGLSSDNVRTHWQELPNLAQAVRSGAFTFTSRAETRTHSSINWGTHLYGHGASSHCWLRNDQQPACTGLPSLFDVVKPSFGVSADWPYFATFNRHVRDVEDDRAVMRVALEALRQRDNKLIFVRFESVDEANHARRGVLDELIKFDNNVGELLAGLRSEDHAVILSDHGSRRCHALDWFCQAHYSANLSEINTPLILLGPSVKPGQLQRRVTHQDTSYFVLSMLGLRPPCQWVLGDYRTNCSLDWPGMEINLSTEEEDLRDGIGLAINIVASIVLALAAVLFYSCCVRSSGKYTHLV